MKRKFTMTMACTPVGNKGPECPTGWTSVGYTQPGSCTIGSVPGNGSMDVWQTLGYQRVCKRVVPSSGDLRTDCCGDFYGVKDTVECRANGLTPYSATCNIHMNKRCDTRSATDPLRGDWNGMPLGQTTARYNPCNNTIRPEQPPEKTGCLDKWCVNYLTNAPANTFYKEHDFTDHGYWFPRYSYQTPDFSQDQGYYPSRTSYLPYNDWRHKNANNFCKQNPAMCLNRY